MIERRNAWRPDGNIVRAANTRQLGAALGEPVADRPGPREWDRLLALVGAQRQRIDATLAVLDETGEQAVGIDTLDRIRRALTGDTE